MYRIDTIDAETKLPEPQEPGPKPDCYFTNGDPQRGQPGTILHADWANSVQEEICHVIEAGGLTLDKMDRTQLLKAIKKIAVPPKIAFTAGQKGPPYQVIQRNTIEKMRFDDVTFNYNNDYDPKDSRFKPSIDGLYLIISKVFLERAVADPITGYASIGLHVNGNRVYSNISETFLAREPTSFDMNICALLEMKGASDYVETYVQTLVESEFIVAAGALNSFFQAIRIR